MVIKSNPTSHTYNLVCLGRSSCLIQLIRLSIPFVSLYLSSILFWDFLKYYHISKNKSN